jgi:hypothetical protein
MSVDEYYRDVLGVVHGGAECEICKIIEGGY